MSAVELIEQLKSMSAREREAFVRLFQEMEKPRAAAGGNGSSTSGPGKWPDFSARLKRIYGEKVSPDSEAVISFSRGSW